MYENKLKFRWSWFISEKTLEFHNILIVARSAFHNDNKYYPQIFLHACLYKLAEWDINIGIW